MTTMGHQGATREGTAAYAQRLAGTAADGHFRPALGLTVSSIGLGTYLGSVDEATDRAYQRGDRSRRSSAASTCSTPRSATACSAASA